MMIQILFVLVFLVFFFIGAGISIKIIADAKRFNIHFEKCRMEKRKQKKRDTEISEDQYITVLHAGNHILILYV